MKGIKSVAILILIGAFIAVGINTANAAVNVYINATMPYDVLYQGEVVSANITVKNNENFPVRIYSVGAHYDWMPANALTFANLGGDYVQVESSETRTPGQLLIEGDNNVSTGYHSFYYNIALSWYNSYNTTWINESVVQPGTIYVESPLKPEALQELQFANGTLSGARSTNFTSRKGADNIQKASDTLNDGWSAYNMQDFGRAINDSHLVIGYVTDARSAEKNYRENASEIERIVLSVNDKLKSVKSTTDPNTLNAIQEALGYLNRTKGHIDAEDFVSALTYANLADQAADRAIQQQFYYFLKTNETEAAKTSAGSALDMAQKSLDNAANMTSVSSVGMLNDARSKMSDATLLFGGGDYGNATIKANVVSTLVTQANSDEANYRMMLARNKIASAADLKSQGAKELLANASREYNRSESDYTANDYLGAIVHADAAMKLANDSAAAEQKWRDDNPINTVTPGFEALAMLLAFGAIFIWKERKG